MVEGGGMINPGMISSNTDDWATPQAFFDRVSAEFGPFAVDVCASVENAKAPKFFSREQDGLKQEWAGTVWMNPPYGREIKHWVKKAYESARGGAIVVCLVPARTDTAWWWDFVQDKAEVRFIRGRLRFGNAKANAPFPSALVIFWPSAFK